MPCRRIVVSTDNSPCAFSPTTLTPNGHKDLSTTTGARARARSQTCTFLRTKASFRSRPNSNRSKAKRRNSGIDAAMTVARLLAKGGQASPKERHLRRKGGGGEPGRRVELLIIKRRSKRGASAPAETAPFPGDIRRKGLRPSADVRGLHGGAARGDYLFGP